MGAPRPSRYEGEGMGAPRLSSNEEEGMGAFIGRFFGTGELLPPPNLPPLGGGAKLPPQRGGLREGEPCLAQATRLGD
jgi:hypothetical protein